MGTTLSLHHFLYNKGDKDSDRAIYLRITYDRKKAEMHSGYTAKLKEWNEDSEMTKANTPVNNELTKQKSKVMHFKIELEKANKPVSAAILKDLMTGKNKTDVYLIEYLAAYIKELEIRAEIKPVSLAKYTQSKNTIEEYIKTKYGLNDLIIDKVNFEFVNGYDLFLKQKQNLHKNTINKYHSRLRTILLRANAEGILSTQPYSNFKLISVKTDRDFLSQEDLNKIIEADFSHNLSLDKVKDIFLFSCYTGLRFQDAQNLTTGNLTNYKSKVALRYAQEKTGKPVDVPLLPVAKNILNKYKNEPERKILNKLLPKISNQKVNSYLKIISDQSGLNKPITHHMARHTFATTVCLNNGMPMEDVSRLLGHSNIKTTQIYGRITQERLHQSIQKINKKIKPNAQ
jgi:integrase/recombinase XerD